MLTSKEVEEEVFQGLGIIPLEVFVASKLGISENTSAPRKPSYFKVVPVPGLLFGDHHPYIAFSIH